uniref:Uncharacterized protein n=1 Tax=Arion vulgaris TaxID=1028688 RepID=A0A0B7BMN5_9EUPU
MKVAEIFPVNFDLITLLYNCYTNFKMLPPLNRNAPIGLLHAPASTHLVVPYDSPVIKSRIKCHSSVRVPGGTNTKIDRKSFRVKIGVPQMTISEPILTPPWMYPEYGVLILLPMILLTCL